MNSSNRLLFAAARGARIQYHWNQQDVDWVDVQGNPQYICDDHRIHPEDLHLQYSPISTALREMAETGKGPYTLSGLMALKAFDYEVENHSLPGFDGLQLQMFLLILAEALADEGM